MITACSHCHRTATTQAVNDTCQGCNEGRMVACGGTAAEFAALPRQEQPIKQATADRFTAAFDDLLDESPTDALALITGIFVSLTTSILRAQGHDASKPIKIDGGELRDITIHPPKQAKVMAREPGA